MRYTVPDPKPAPREKKARKPLSRSRMKRKRARRIDRQTAEDRAFLAFVHRQPCRLFFMYGAYRCDGPIQAAHFRNGTGVGRKEPDSTCIPLCRSHHEQYDQANGYFRGISRDERKAWHLHQQAAVRADYLGAGPRYAEGPR